MTPYIQALADARGWTLLPPDTYQEDHTQVFLHPLGPCIHVEKEIDQWVVRDHEWVILGHQKTRTPYYQSFRVPRASPDAVFQDDLDRVFGNHARARLSVLSKSIWAWTLATHDVPLDADIRLTRSRRRIRIGDSPEHISLPAHLDPLFADTQDFLGFDEPESKDDTGLCYEHMFLQRVPSMHERLALMASGAPDPRP